MRHAATKLLTSSVVTAGTGKGRVARAKTQRDGVEVSRTANARNSGGAGRCCVNLRCREWVCVL